ncbi:MAG TPA: helix-turn-helix domain-containing protein [Bacteroidia bacterium]|nr:helix-turn-helix domain-containing protein [Bacteroidia bacterium]
MARQLRGLTQEQLADKIGKTRPLVSQIEVNGKVNAYTLQKICDVLELDIEQFDGETAFEMAGTFTKKKASQKKATEDNSGELEALRELVKIQKEMIDVLRKKLGKK